MGDVWLSPVSITASSNQLNCKCYSVKKSTCVWRSRHSLDFALTMKLKPRHVVYSSSSVKVKSFSLETTRMSFLEKPEAVRKSRIHFLEERDEEMLSKRLLKLSRSDKLRSASELFDSMRVSSLQPNPHACNSFLSCLLRNGDLQRVFTVFEFMRTKENLTGHTYSLLLKAVSEAKGCDSALRMFREIENDPNQKRYFDVVLYNTVISLCGRVNNVCETERVWRVMSSDGLVGTEVTYSLLVSIFVRCGRSELALDAYDEMINNKITPREDAMHALPFGVSDS
ncbi:pentatricopeptide repeat-containing protein At3g29290-like [Raphanus sativus]|uniref:Pentatricopeptide repeat-containing protein At3g29290-like n=1 Tax=Raphanus sativus TaxID=3726 RepID=A0A9W3BUT5_RAPSA|nr:pentatricopeptide repeat-containing protein At3g29290-like [Raphanus sativus]